MVKKKAMGFLVGQTMKAMKGKSKSGYGECDFAGTSCLGILV